MPGERDEVCRQTASAQQLPRPEENEMPRVALNQTAPDFSLPDYSGRSVSLSDFRDRKNVLLVFNRGFT
jgi:cytochrome oxidase Cu insertion factor (SCO1/SenC/PrrC family)